MQVVNKKMCVIVILLLVIIESCTLFLMYKSYGNKNTNLDEVNLNINNTNMFAIMLEQDDGTYKEDASNTWPSESYSYNADMSGCIDLNGNKLDGVLTYDATNNIATVDIGATSYCYLYFDKELLIPILEFVYRDDPVEGITEDGNISFILSGVADYTYNGDGEISCYTDSELITCAIQGGRILLSSSTTLETTFTLTLETSEGEQYQAAKIFKYLTFTWLGSSVGGGL